MNRRRRKDCPPPSSRGRQDMPPLLELLSPTLSALGITRYGVVPVASIAFSAAFRDLCATNRCGKYGTNWTCPPGVGPFDTLVAQVRRFTSGLVIQTVWPIEDSFDIEGMLAAGGEHNALFRRAVTALAPQLQGVKTLPLSAGACSICGTCTFADGEPCRRPEQAIASLEAYGIDVAQLIASSGLSYTNGPNTVSYVGLLLIGMQELEPAVLTP